MLYLAAVSLFCFSISLFLHCHKGMQTATHLSMSTHTDQTILKVTQHLFYLHFTYYPLSSFHPPIHPIAPVPAVHPCVIDGRVHPSFPSPLSAPLSLKPLHPSLLPAVTRWLTTCLQQSTKAAITLHVQQRETHTSTNTQCTLTYICMRSLNKQHTEESKLCDHSHNQTPTHLLKY